MLSNKRKVINVIAITVVLAAIFYCWQNPYIISSILFNQYTGPFTIEEIQKRHVIGPTIFFTDDPSLTTTYYYYVDSDGNVLNTHFKNAKGETIASLTSRTPSNYTVPVLEKQVAIVWADNGQSWTCDFSRIAGLDNYPTTPDRVRSPCLIWWHGGIMNLFTSDWSDQENIDFVNALKS